MKKYISLGRYYNFATNQFAKLFSPLIYRWEKPFLKDYDNHPLKHQPVFIIGAPRTGSTILYQALTNLYDVLYVDNLTCKFHRNFFFGFWLSHKLYGTKPHNNYQADHGSTKALHSPSECGQFWYRWLPKDHHFIDYDEITPQVVEEIRKEITAVINYFNKPLVFKNLNAGQRMRLLTKCFPEAKFLFITRVPVYTAQAILKSKRVLGLKDTDFWSIKPTNVEELEKLDGYEQIVKQVYFLERQIVDDSALVGNGCFYTLQLKDLSVHSISELARSLGFAKRAHDPELPSIHVYETVSIGDKEFESLQKQVVSLDWSFMRASPNQSASKSTTTEAST